METIRDKLIEIANKNTSDERDEKIIQYVMDKLNLKGRITYGIVYLEPYDTQPTDIHTFAKTLLKLN